MPKWVTLMTIDLGSVLQQRMKPAWALVPQEGAKLTSKDSKWVLQGAKVKDFGCLILLLKVQNFPPQAENYAVLVNLGPFLVCTPWTMFGPLLIDSKVSSF